MFKLPSGKRIGYGEAFTVGDTQYPGNWLSLVTREERAAIGITEIVEQPRPDDRYYWVTENDDGSFSTAPKDLAELKKIEIANIKLNAAALLAPSDWRAVRAFENGVAMDPAWTAYRAAVRKASSDAEAAVQAADFDALIKLSAVVFPHDPDYVEPGVK
jgi:hypothetical protein